MKVCEVINFEMITQQVLFIQGYKNPKAILKQFVDDTEIRKLMEISLKDYEYYYERADGWVDCLEEGNTMLPILYISKPLNTNSLNDMGTLVHEIMHVVQHIRNRFWRNHDEIEFEAYVFEFLYKRIMELLINKSK